jgi:hypothetical protein
MQVKSRTPLLLLAAAGLIGVAVAGTVGAVRRSNDPVIQSVRWDGTNLTHSANAPDVAMVRLTAADASQPGMVLVSAELKQTEFDPFPQFWTVRVTMESGPDTGRVVHEADYRHQTFTPPNGKPFTATFDETLRLQPGRYRVTIGIKQPKAQMDTNGQWVPAGFELGLADSAAVTIR